MEVLNGLIEKINVSSLAGVQWQVPVIILLVFLLILTLAQVRRHFVDWSFKGAVSGVAIGFFLAIVVEGFLLVYGKTFIIQTLGWSDAPKPISVALDTGRRELSKVLGVGDEIGGLQATKEMIQSLNPAEVKQIKSLICTP